MGGPKSDMPGPNPDMGGPNPDNNTILIENPLVEPCLKDPCYVDAGLPTSPTKSLTPDKLKQVKDVHPFAKPIFKTGKGTGSEKSQKSKLSDKGSGPSKDQLLTVSGTDQLQDSDKSTNLQQSSLSEPVTELVALSSSASSIPTSPPSASTSESDHYTSGPKSRTRVKLSKSLEDALSHNGPRMIEEAGENGHIVVEVAYHWIQQFLQQTKVEELLEVLKIIDQQALHDKLADLFAPHLAKHVELPYLKT